MIVLQQSLSTDDDSFSYTVRGEDTMRYHVDNHGNLFERGTHIGRFRLISQQWSLYLGDELFMHGPRMGLFKLPEFELKALTALVNQERPSAL